MYESCDKRDPNYAGFGLPYIEEKPYLNRENKNPNAIDAANQKIENYKEIIDNLHSKIDRLENTVKELDKLCKDLSDENKNLRMCIENQRENIRSKNEVFD